VPQGEDPEFKPQYHQKEKKNFLQKAKFTARLFHVACVCKIYPNLKKKNFKLVLRIFCQ
jgi:hypothetical protein